jgi:hypothetical protein
MSRTAKTLTAAVSAGVIALATSQAAAGPQLRPVHLRGIPIHEQVLAPAAPATVQISRAGQATLRLG